MNNSDRNKILTTYIIIKLCAKARNTFEPNPDKALSVEDQTIGSPHSGLSRNYASLASEFKFWALLGVNPAFTNSDSSKVDNNACVANIQTEKDHLYSIISGRLRYCL